MATGTCQVSGMESEEEQRKSIEAKLILTTKNLRTTLYDTFNNQWAETEAKRLVTQLLNEGNKTNEEIESLITEANKFIIENEQVVFTNIYGYSEAGYYIISKVIQILTSQILLIP